MQSQPYLFLLMFCSSSVGALLHQNPILQQMNPEMKVRELLLALLPVGSLQQSVTLLVHGKEIGMGLTFHHFAASTCCRGIILILTFNQQSILVHAFIVTFYWLNTFVIHKPCFFLTPLCPTLTELRESVLSVKFLNLLV